MSLVLVIWGKGGQASELPVLDFTGTILGALAFHRPVSLPQDATTPFIVGYLFLYTTPFADTRGGGPGRTGWGNRRTERRCSAMGKS